MDFNKSILDPDYFDKNLFGLLTAQLGKPKYMDEEWVYFTSIQDKWMKVKSRTGKEFNIPPNMLFEKNLLERVSSIYIPNYKGRAKKLFRMTWNDYLQALDIWDNRVRPIENTGWEFELK